MMEQINSQNPQSVVRGVLRATCRLFGDKKEQQIFCFYETSHIHDPNGPSMQCETSQICVRTGAVTNDWRCNKSLINMHTFPSISAARGRERFCFLCFDQKSV